MELEPRTITGKVIIHRFQSWKNAAREQLLEKLKRVLCLYSSKITNPDSFLSALHTQNALDELPLTSVSDQSVSFKLELIFGRSLKATA